MFESVQPVVQDFITTLVSGLLAVLGAFLIALTKKGFDWLGTRIDKIKDEKAQSAFDSALNSLEVITTTTVTSLQQTLGDQIKESIEKADGTYTRDDLLILKDKAVETIKSQLTDSAKKALSSVYNDLDGFISDLIESKVRDLKSQIIY